MKNFLISILILSILVTVFSTIDGRIEFDYSLGNWTIPSNMGKPTIENGEHGDSKQESVNTFSFGTVEPVKTIGGNTKIQDFSSITVEVVEAQKMTQQKEDTLAWILTGIAGLCIVGCHVFTICAYVQYFKERKLIKISAS